MSSINTTYTVWASSRTTRKDWIQYEGTDQNKARKAMAKAQASGKWSEVYLEVNGVREGHHCPSLAMENNNPLVIRNQGISLCLSIASQKAKNRPGRSECPMYHLNILRPSFCVPVTLCGYPGNAMAFRCMPCERTIHL